MKLSIWLMILLSLHGCTSIPENIQPVSDFDIQKYMGTWYEIARLDHRFERGMDQVTAMYSLEKNGRVRVVNRGFVTKKEEWKEAEGKARIAHEPEAGHLEVSFFGPFYGPYIIFELEEKNYEYAFVTSGEKYLWLLSRTPEISDNVRDKFINRSRELGFSVDELIFVDQNKNL